MKPIVQFILAFNCSELCDSNEFLANDMKCHNRIFTATNEFQVIIEGQEVPMGKLNSTKLNCRSSLYLEF